MNYFQWGSMETESLSFCVCCCCCWCACVCVCVCVCEGIIHFFSVIMFAKNNRESVLINANGLCECVRVCVCVSVSVHVLYQNGLSPSCLSVFKEIAIDEPHCSKGPHAVLKAVHSINADNNFVHLFP